MGLDYTIVYKLGTKNKVDDALSHRFPSKLSLVYSAPLSINKTDLMTQTKADP